MPSCPPVRRWSRALPATPRASTTAMLWRSGWRAPSWSGSLAGPSSRARWRRPRRSASTCAWRTMSARSPWMRRASSCTVAATGPRLVRRRRARRWPLRLRPSVGASWRSRRWSGTPSAAPAAWSSSLRWPGASRSQASIGALPLSSGRRRRWRPSRPGGPSGLRAGRSLSVAPFRATLAPTSTHAASARVSAMRSGPAWRQRSPSPSRMLRWPTCPAASATRCWYSATRPTATAFAVRWTPLRRLRERLLSRRAPTALVMLAPRGLAEGYMARGGRIVAEIRNGGIPVVLLAWSNRDDR